MEEYVMQVHAFHLKRKPKLANTGYNYKHVQRKKN
jgi:hypothetical protein